jgi:Flp pilus assembly protein TadB
MKFVLGSCFKAEWETAGAYVWVGILLAGSVGVASLYATVLTLTVQIIILIAFVVVSLIGLVILEMDYTKRRTRHNTQCSQKSQNENN